MAKKNRLYLFSLIVLLSVFLSAAESRAIGVKMPDFALPEVTDGRPIDTQELHGKVLLVIFFATWCPPCREEVPSLVSLQKEFGRDGFSVIGLSVDESRSEDVGRLVKKMGINYPVVMADPGTIRGFGGVYGIPVAFLVSQKGNIVKKYSGYVPHSIFVNDIKSEMN